MSALSPTEIVQTAARTFNVPVDELTGLSRRRPVVWMRQAAMTVMREATGYSYPSIGRIFGGRDHTTVIHAIRACEERGVTGRYADDLRRVLHELEQRVPDVDVTIRCECGWTRTSVVTPGTGAGALSSVLAKLHLDHHDHVTSHFAGGAA